MGKGTVNKLYIPLGIVLNQFLVNGWALFLKVHLIYCTLILYENWIGYCDVLKVKENYIIRRALENDRYRVDTFRSNLRKPLMFDFAGKILQDFLYDFMVRKQKWGKKKVFDKSQAKNLIINKMKTYKCKDKYSNKDIEWTSNVI